MNNFEIVILALALVFNSWATYLNAGIALSGIPLIRKVRYSGIMFFVQFIMAGVGIWIGFKTGSLEVWVNMAISLSLMLIFGLKLLLTGIKTSTEEKAFDYSDSKVTFLAAIAEGITPLAIGIAIGLLSMFPYLHWLITGTILLVGIISGLIVSARMGNESFKLRFGPLGGLLLLAASIHMATKLVGF
jgi:putative Mn2+ efflux pump MntP